MLFQVGNSNAQNSASPSEGKSLVYFVRSSGTGALVNFKYFDGETYLGKFSGLNYFILECEPGKHIFWVTSENRDFVEAELLPDKVYFIEVRPTIGAVYAAVKLFPVGMENQVCSIRSNLKSQEERSSKGSKGKYGRKEVRFSFSNLGSIIRQTSNTII